MDVVAHDIDELVARLRAVDWLRALLFVIVVFHALAASVLLFAPEPQVVTPGTRPALDLITGLSVWTHRIGWAVIYLACTAALAGVWFHPTVRNQWTAWLLAIPSGFVWAGASGIAVIDGEGSAYGLVIFVTLLAFFGIVAVATAVRDQVPRAR